jgi:hypothetical protein
VFWALLVQVPLQHQQELLDVLDMSGAAVESIDAAAATGSSATVIAQVGASGQQVPAHVAMAVQQAHCEVSTVKCPL